MGLLSLHISNVWHQELRGAINIIITAVLEVVQDTIVDPWKNNFRAQAVNANVIGQDRKGRSSVWKRETRPKNSSREPD